MIEIIFFLSFCILYLSIFIYGEYKHRQQMKKCARCKYFNVNLYYAPCVDCLFEKDRFEERGCGF